MTERDIGVFVQEDALRRLFVDETGGVIVREELVTGDEARASAYAALFGGDASYEEAFAAAVDEAGGDVPLAVHLVRFPNYLARRAIYEEQAARRDDDLV